MKSRRRMLAAWIAVACALVGCGSAGEGARDATVSDAPTAPETGDEARCLCPFCTYCGPTEPSVGAACPENGMVCEYGNDYHFRCNTLYTCAAGTWSLSAPDGGCPSDAGMSRPRLGTVYLYCDQFNVDCFGVGGCGCPVYASKVLGADCDGGTAADD